MAFDKNKFTWKELTMNQDGKQSASGFIGVYLGIIAGASFIGTMFGYFLKIPGTVEVMNNIIQLVFATSLLLGVRKAGDFMRRRGRNSESSSETTTTSSAFSSAPQDQSSEEDEQQPEVTTEMTEGSSSKSHDDPDNPA